MVIIIILVVASYLVGVESAKSRGKDYEDLRHQLERLWMSSDAKKSRPGRASHPRNSIDKARKSRLGTGGGGAIAPPRQEHGLRDPETGRKGRSTMSAGDKIEAAADKATGKAKEAVGNVTGDDGLVAEGKADQAKGHIKDAVENVKDAFKK